MPVPYSADRAKAEAILLEAARHALSPFDARATEAREHLCKAYGLPIESHEPRAFWRLTDNCVEITIRFMVPEHGIREIKDRISREILANLEAAGIGIASTTMEVTVMKPS